MGTGLVQRISIHTVHGTAPPTLPAAGSYFDSAALISAGWFPIGSIHNGDSGDIDSEGVKVTPYREGTDINPPGAQTRQGRINRKRGIDNVTFTSYDVSRGIFVLDSSVEEVGTPGSEIYDMKTAQTYRAMMVEVGGLYVDWYPRVDLAIVGEPGGYGPGDDAVSKLEFEASVMDYDDRAGSTGVFVKSGRLRMYLQEAGS